MLQVFMYPAEELLLRFRCVALLYSGNSIHQLRFNFYLDFYSIRSFPTVQLR